MLRSDKLIGESSFEYINVCIKLDSTRIKALMERKRCKVMDRLLCSVHFFDLFIVHGWNLLCRL